MAPLAKRKKLNAKAAREARPGEGKKIEDCSSAEGDIRLVPGLPLGWEFFVDAYHETEIYRERMKIYAVDTTDTSIYHVTDFPSPDDDQYNCCFSHMAVVADGTNIYAVGDLTGDGWNFWTFEIVGARKWCKGPKLLSAKSYPILFTLDQRLYVLDAWSETSYKVKFEVLDLRLGKMDMCFKQLKYQDFRIGSEIDAIAIDEEKSRVYCKFGRADPLWIVYHARDGYWDHCGDGFNVDDCGLFNYNLMQLPPFYSSSIFESEIHIFHAPFMFWDAYGYVSAVCKGPVPANFGEGPMGDSCPGELIRYNLETSGQHVVRKGLKCPVEDFDYDGVVYFALPLNRKDGDLFLISIFSDPTAPGFGELAVYLIKSEEEEQEGKNTSSESIMATSELIFKRYKGGCHYMPRELQQLRQLKST